MTTKQQNIPQIMKFWLSAVLILLIPMLGCAQGLWIKTFGGDKGDHGFAVRQTSDSGYIIVGKTSSFGKGLNDVYLIKTDSMGDTLWTKTFGGVDDDKGHYVQQITDGGYIIVGSTQSFGESYEDVYLLKTDTAGDTIWTRTYGDSSFGSGHFVQQTKDKGFIIVGRNCLIKTDSMGKTQWMKTLNGANGYYVQQTNEEGYIVTGVFNDDVYLMKTDSLGNTLFTKTFGCEYLDVGYSVQQTNDDGFIVIGSISYIKTCELESNIYLIKTDVSGDTLWTRSFGNTYSDIAYSGQQTLDGGFIIVGETIPKRDIDSDIYLVKTDSLGNTLWTKTFGGSERDVGYSVQQTSDGSYIIAGTIDYDVCLIKTDNSGNVGIDKGKNIEKKYPKSFYLFQNYPNPFNQSTNIRYELIGKNQEVEMSIYDISGKEVRKLVQKNHSAGIYNVLWDGKDEKGDEVSSGIYFYQLKTEKGRFKGVEKLVLIR